MRPDRCGWRERKKRDFGEKEELEREVPAELLDISEGEEGEAVEDRRWWMKRAPG
jgi:hypothetical protein